MSILNLYCSNVQCCISYSALYSSVIEKSYSMSILTLYCSNVQCCISYSVLYSTVVVAFFLAGAAQKLSNCNFILYMMIITKSVEPRESEPKAFRKLCDRTDQKGSATRKLFESIYIFRYCNIDRKVRENNTI